MVCHKSSTCVGSLILVSKRVINKLHCEKLPFEGVLYVSLKV